MIRKISLKFALYGVRFVLGCALLAAALFVYSVQTWEQPCVTRYTAGIENTCNTRGK